MAETNQHKLAHQTAVKIAKGEYKNIPTKIAKKLAEGEKNLKKSRQLTNEQLNRRATV